MKQWSGVLLAVVIVSTQSWALDVKKAVVSTSEAIAKGKATYQAMCVTCHGAEGKGDGAAAAALNPKPRNFVNKAEKWKQGDKVLEIVKTLTDGVPGTPMPGWPAISLEDRFAVAHYLRSLAPDRPADTEAEIAKSPYGGEEKKVERLPVEFMMQKMATDGQNK